MTVTDGLSPRRPAGRLWRGGVAALVALVGLAGCTGSDDDSPDGGSVQGVLRSTDLTGNGWTTTDVHGETLCGGLSSIIRSVARVADSSRVTFVRDGVTVTSEAWVARTGSGSRRGDFDRIRGQVNLCGPSGSAGELGITDFDVTVDEPERFVIQERRVVDGVAGGADQLYFTEGPVVGLVVVAYEGERPPFAVTDLEDEARAHARELSASDA